MDRTRRRLLGGFLLTVVATFVLATRRASRATARLVAALRDAANTRRGDPVGPGSLEGLRAPVRRYFETVLPDGQRPVRTARLRQRGELQMGEGDSGWRSFTATQTVTADPPGFV
jgi:hypothetical protein